MDSELERNQSTKKEIVSFAILHVVFLAYFGLSFTSQSLTSVIQYVFLALRIVLAFLIVLSGIYLFARKKALVLTIGAVYANFLIFDILGIVNDIAEDFGGDVLLAHCTSAFFYLISILAVVLFALRKTKLTKIIAIIVSSVHLALTVPGLAVLLMSFTESGYEITALEKFTAVVSVCVHLCILLCVIFTKIDNKWAFRKNQEIE